MCPRKLCSADPEILLGLVITVGLLIRGTASDVLGIVSDTVFRNTVRDNNTVTSEIRQIGIIFRQADFSVGSISLSIKTISISFSQSTKAFDNQFPKIPWLIS